MRKGIKIMDIELSNNCSKTIVVSVDNGNRFCLYPNEKKKVVLSSDADNVVITVRQEECSYFKKTFFHKNYRLSIETKYVFFAADNESMTLEFLREIVCVKGNVYYEKIILKNKPNNFISEYSKICELESIERIYNRRYIIYQIFISPFEHMTFLCIIAFIISIVIAFMVGIIFSLVFFVISYSMILGLNLICHKLFNLFSKKILKIEDDASEFKKILNEEFLNEFFNKHIFNSAFSIYVDGQ